MNIKFKKEDIVLITIAVIVVLLYITAFICFISTAKHKSNQSIIVTKKQANTNNIEVQQNNSDAGQEATTTEWRCLGDDEEAGFYSRWKGFNTDSLPEKYPLEVIIRDKVSKAEKNKIIIDNIRENYHPVEVRKCGIYILREFNFDKKKFKLLSGYSMALWKYDYNINKEKFIIFREKYIDSDFDSGYSYDFRVSPNEKYIVLEKGYWGGKDENYSIVIKDLNTKEDIFVLQHREILEKYPKMDATFDFREWTSDSRYFWGAITMGAHAFGYFRIDTKNWTYDIYEPPLGQMGGEKLNIETGWVTHHTDLVWTGIHQLTEELRAERREQGIGTKFYLYNLFTKKKILVYETDEPIFFTKPEWISDTEVEYKLPSGEKKVYELN